MLETPETPCEVVEVFVWNGVAVELVVYYAHGVVVELLREVVAGHFGDHLALLGLRVALGDLLVDLVLQ